MINIAKQLFVVKGVDREEELAYMSPYQTNKEGEPLANISKMQATGRSWASVGPKQVYKLKPDAKSDHDWLRDDQGRVIVDYVAQAREGEEFIFDNVAMSGFYVGSSVARWSTSNKLFRVKDPRGFTVEIPTDNLATLLHHTTVVKGVVVDECVWGREGTNHILLPVNSSPYLITLDQMDTLNNKLIKIKDLKVGDWVKLFEDDTEYYYAGKLRGTWKIRGYSRGNSYYNSLSRRDVEYPRYSEWVEYTDDKFEHIFLPKGSSDKLYATVTKTPKITEIIKNDKINLDIDMINWYCPQRILNKSCYSDYYSSYEAQLVGIEEKK